MQQEPYQRKFADPDTDDSGAEPDQGKAGRDTRRDTVGRAFRRGVERGTAGAVKAVLRGLLTAAIVLIAPGAVSDVAPPGRRVCLCTF